MSTRALVFCDRCHTSIAANYDEAHLDLIDRAEHHGWISIRSAEGWQNVCPNCLNTNNKEATNA